MILKPTLALILLLLPGLALAGTPVEEERICPVGGESFTVTGTLSCSTMGASMSMRQLTSCDFVTLLPVCPSNGLPLYRDFAAPEIAVLEPYLQGPDWGAIADRSPYLRAHAIERLLSGEDSETAYWLLQGGLWHDRAAMLATPGTMDLFLAEAERQKGRVTAEDRPYFLGAVAYQLAADGRDQAARDWLAEARAASDGSDFLTGYFDALAACIGDMGRAGCGSDDPFDP